MAEILYIAHRIPYPPNKGDKIRSYNEVKHLSNGHTVDLACLADDPADLEYAKDLQKFCRRLFVQGFSRLRAKVKGMISLVSGECISVGYFYQKTLQKQVDQWLKETAYDAVVCFSSPMAEYIYASSLLHNKRDQNGKKSSAQPPRLIMDFCDLDSDKWGQYGKKAAFPMNLIYQMEHQRLLAYENRINQDFDHSIFISRQEAQLFYNYTPGARNVAVIPNGVDAEFFSPEYQSQSVPDLEDLSRGPVLMFAGAMDYHANADGVVWFCREILPILKNSFPDIRLLIVGNRPAPEVERLGNNPGVTVTGFVEDIRPYYRAADLSVIPLRIARGVQNKVLEAMSMGNALVTTPVAIQGLISEAEKHLLVAEDPKRFAGAVIDLLNRPEALEKMGEDARAFVKEHYNWEKNMKILEELVEGRGR